MSYKICLQEIDNLIRNNGRSNIFTRTEINRFREKIQTIYDDELKREVENGKTKNKES